MIVLARTVGLAQIDLHALEHLEAAGQLTPGELQDRLGLSSGAVTALIDRLQGIGCVLRAPNPQDRRSVLVRLSQRAAAEGEARLGAYHAAVESALRELTAEERATVARLLGRLAEGAHAQAAALRDRS